MKRKLLPLTSMAMATLLVLANCGEDSTPGPVTLEVTNVQAADVANFGDGRDLQVTFDEIDDPALKEYRLIAVPEGEAGAFDLESAANLGPDSYRQVLPADFKTRLRFEATTRDANGNALSEGESYIVFVASIPSEANPNAVGTIGSSGAVTLIQETVVNTLSEGFSASGGIVVGPDGSIYVADFGTGSSNGTTILRFNADGELEETFARGLLGPTGGAFDSRGNLFWSSYSARKVHRIDASGNVFDYADIAGPVAIAVDDNDNLFIASCDGNTIQRVSAAGVVSTFATSPLFNCINGLIITETGVLFGCNFEDGRILQISASGVVSSFARIPTGSSVNMTYHDGFLYVTGRDAHQIYVVSTETGTIETLAGTGVRGKEDGPALKSQFSLPNGISFNNERTRLYINDVSPNSNAFNPNSLRVIELLE